MVNPHLKYLWYVLRHKWFVFIAGRKVGGIPLWSLIIHDMSKFSKAEWGPYVRRFFSGRSGIEDKTLDSNEFKRAFEHHWHNNPHHWEYWVLPLGGVQVMPERYAREMVADWMGAGRAITGSWDLTEWYNKNSERQRLTLTTRGLVEDILYQQGFYVQTLTVARSTGGVQWR